MPLNSPNCFHFSAPDGTISLTLEPNKPRITTPVMAATFAGHIAAGEINGKVEGNTVTLLYVANKSVDSALDDEAEPEEELYEPEPEVQAMLEAANPVVEKSRSEAIATAVASIMTNGDKRQMTETGTPRVSSVRKKSFPDVAPEEVDAAFDAYTADASE